MNILNRITMLFFLVIFVAIGVFLLLVSVKFIQSEPLLNTLDYIYASMNLRVGVAVIGGLLILISIAAYQFTVARIERQKNIAFNNPDGRVTISLSAIEEFIKRIGSSLSEVKELKSDCIATKKGIDISTRVIFWSDANIPEATEKIQSLIRTRIQEMLGVDEPIIVKVHVTKIASRQEQRHEKKDKEKDKDDLRMPFSGMEYRND
jgi:heme/copper-type cytochrome/quinol oxidase subunit 2